MKSAIADLASEAKIMSVTTRYIFKYSGSRKDASNKKNGNPPEQASLFLHACRSSGLKAEYNYSVYFNDEEGVCVEVIEGPSIG